MVMEDYTIGFHFVSKYHFHISLLKLLWYIVIKRNIVVSFYLHAHKPSFHHMFFFIIPLLFPAKLSSVFPSMLSCLHLFMYLNIYEHFCHIALVEKWFHIFTFVGNGIYFSSCIIFLFFDHPPSASI